MGEDVGEGVRRQNALGTKYRNTNLRCLSKNWHMLNKLIRDGTDAGDWPVRSNFFRPIPAPVIKNPDWFHL